MSRRSPAPANAHLGLQKSLPQPSDGQQARSPHSSPLRSVDVEDHPRSPKRRRVSPADTAPKYEPTAPSSAPAPAPSSQGQGPPEQNQHVAPSAARSVAGVPKPLLDGLPALDALSSQILTFLARLTPAEALGLSNTPNLPSTREYVAMRSSFDLTRRLYNTGSPFLSPRDVRLVEPEQVEILRKANLAIFMSSIFTGEIGLRDMDQTFLSVFVPENGKLLKAQASIYLELKTQGFITAWRTGAAPPAVVMADLFGPDLDKAILARRPGTSAFAPSEQDFLNRLSSRRDILQTHVKNNTLDQLPLKYRWEDFSREVSSYLSKLIESSASTAAGAAAADATTGDPTRALHRRQMEGQFSIHTPPTPMPSIDAILPAAPSIKPVINQDDFAAQAARAAEIALKEVSGVVFSDSFALAPSPSTPRHKDTPTPQPTSSDPAKTNAAVDKPPSPSPAAVSAPAPTTTEGAAATTTATDNAHDPANDAAVEAAARGDIPHSSQTAPTSVLYERARLAATTKAALLPVRKGPVQSQRRAWTTDEENALMTGLDKVKGPHWSQILAMYGPGGTINEALKDRNQVQLKDKARNLKMFFLKGGIEVPYYLQYVTGDLRTRAQGKAFRRERDRLLLDADGVDGLPGDLAGDVEESLAPGTADTSNSLSEPGSPVDTPAADDPKPPFEPSKADVDAIIARAVTQASKALRSDGAS